MGTGTLLMVALIPAINCGSGMVPACCTVVPSAVPKTEINWPGAKVGLKEAALSTPAMESCVMGPANGTAICVVQELPFASTPVNTKVSVPGTVRLLSDMCADTEPLARSEEHTSELQSR